MKPDLYTKAVLTIIAVMLTVIAFKEVFHPAVAAKAQTASQQLFSAGASNSTFYFYNPDKQTIAIIDSDGVGRHQLLQIH
jgi:hypothetical protein